MVWVQPPVPWSTGGIRQAQPLLLSISEVLFWCCWPLDFQSWVSWSHTSEHDQAAPSQASGPPHKHLTFIKMKFSMSCIFMCTGALFWVYLVCLMPLGSSAVFFPSQLFGVHTFPISIPLKTVSSFEMDELFLGKLLTSFLTFTAKVQLKIWSQLFSPIQDLNEQHSYEEKLNFPPLSEI